MNDRLTDGVAVGALASPIWLPWLDHMSSISAKLLPVVGLVWIIVQMVHFWMKRNKQ